MEKTSIQQALERAYSNPTSDWLNPDNHDKVNIALGLFANESAEKDREVMDNLRGQVTVLSRVVGTTIETQVGKLIESNKALSASNKKSTNAMLWLTGGLIFVGVVQVTVGAIQAYVAYIK